MKTEADFPGITAMRLTGVTNAADDLLHLLDEIIVYEPEPDSPSRWRLVIKAKSRLSRAIEVARGADLPLHRHLFRDTADRSAVRLVETVIGLEDE